MSRSTTQTPTWLDLLRRIEKRDGAVLLWAANGPGDSPDRRQGDAAEQSPTWRVRLLAVEPGDHVLLERPWTEGVPISAHVDKPYYVLFSEGNSRWAFMTTLIEQVKHKLNEQTRVIAWRMAWPQRVKNAQRRDYFRVEMPTNDRPTITLQHLPEAALVVGHERYVLAGIADEPGRPPVEPALPELGETIEAPLLDVSGGGVKLLALRSIEPQVAQGAKFWLTLDLAPMEQTLRIVARPAHWQQKDETHLLLGLAFNFDHHPAYQRFVTDRMCRISAHMQRLMLQRRK